MKTELAQLDTGITLEYALAGPSGAATLLFVHGLGPNLRQFDPRMRFFSRQFQVLLVSLRGHGGSSIPDHPAQADFSIELLAKDIRSLLTKLEIHKVHFVGNSAGGLVGYQLLKAGEDLGLISSLTTFGTTAELHTSASMTWFLTTLTRTLGPGTTGKLARASTRDKGVARQIAEMFATANKSAIWMIQVNIANYDFRPVLRDHVLPVLLIKGEYDAEINARLDSTLHVLRQKWGS